MFSLVIQYFHKEEGIKNFVLDFYESPYETSESIYNEIITRLKMNNLKINDIVSYSADNASVNFGKFKSVFNNLKYENNLLIQANCLCHVIHNCAKHSLMKLPFDFENLIMKIFAHFSSSSKRSDSLKDCYEYCDLEYEKMVKHTKTCWLTLNKALERITNNLEPIKLYFIGIGSEELPNVISDFIRENDEYETPLNELYLRFAYGFTKLLKNSILTFEKKSTSIIVFNEMCNLKGRLRNRIEKKFYGSDINEKLKKYSKEKVTSFEKEAISVSISTKKLLNI